MKLSMFSYENLSYEIILTHVIYYLFATQVILHFQFFIKREYLLMTEKGVRIFNQF